MTRLEPVAILSHGDPVFQPARIAADQGSDIVVDLDPSGTSATITLDTTIDAACAVVHGEDETFDVRMTVG